MILEIICPRNATDAAMADVQTELFQLLRYSRPAMAAKAEARLLFDIHLHSSGNTSVQSRQSAGSHPDAARLALSVSQLAATS